MIKRSFSLFCCNLRCNISRIDYFFFSQNWPLFFFVCLFVDEGVAISGCRDAAAQLALQSLRERQSDAASRVPRWRSQLATGRCRCPSRRCSRRWLRSTSQQTSEIRPYRGESSIQFSSFFFFFYLFWSLHPIFSHIATVDRTWLWQSSKQTKNWCSRVISLCNYEFCSSEPCEMAWSIFLI